MEVPVLCSQPWFYICFYLAIVFKFVAAKILLPDLIMIIGSSLVMKLYVI